MAKISVLFLSFFALLMMGVQCPNCPHGYKIIEQLIYNNVTGEMENKTVTVSIKRKPEPEDLAKLRRPKAAPMSSAERQKKYRESKKDDPEYRKRIREYDARAREVKKQKFSQQAQATDSAGTSQAPPKRKRQPPQPQDAASKLYRRLEFYRTRDALTLQRANLESWQPRTRALASGNMPVPTVPPIINAEPSAATHKNKRGRPRGSKNKENPQPINHMQFYDENRKQLVTPESANQMYRGQPINNPVPTSGSQNVNLPPTFGFNYAGSSYGMPSNMNDDANGQGRSQYPRMGSNLELPTSSRGNSEEPLALSPHNEAEYDEFVRSLLKNP